MLESPAAFRCSGDRAGAANIILRRCRWWLSTHPSTLQEPPLLRCLGFLLSAVVLVTVGTTPAGRNYLVLRLKPVLGKVLLI